MPDVIRITALFVLSVCLEVVLVNVVYVVSIIGFFWFFFRLFGYQVMREKNTSISSLPGMYCTLMHFDKLCLCTLCVFNAHSFKCKQVLPLASLGSLHTYYVYEI